MRQILASDPAYHLIQARKSLVEKVGNQTIHRDDALHIARDRIFDTTTDFETMYFSEYFNKNIQQSESDNINSTSYTYLPGFKSTV